jgi:hypothetical protein
MADAVAFSNFLLNSPVNEEEYTCGRCRDRETQLREALNELRSAQTIISILRNDLILASTTSCTVNRPHTDEPNSDPDIEVWKLAAYNKILKS